MEDRSTHSKVAADPGGQTWDTSAYAVNGRFVADLAADVVGLLSPRQGEHILDLGCGDGALTQKIAASGASVEGVDNSPPMIEAARARGITVHHRSILDLDRDDLLRGRFDAVFSNAALHWMPEAEHTRVLAAIRAVLRPGGRVVAEMGGQGNIAAIRVALSVTMGRFGVDAEAAAGSFFPSVRRYRELLEDAGFTVHSMDLVPRPTPLPGGADGMRRWLTTFRNGVLDGLSPEQRAAALAETISLLTPILSDHAMSWSADYVRLRLSASAP